MDRVLFSQAPRCRPRRNPRHSRSVVETTAAIRAPLARPRRPAGAVTGTSLRAAPLLGGWVCRRKSNWTGRHKTANPVTTASFVPRRAQGIAAADGQTQRLPIERYVAKAYGAPPKRCIRTRGASLQAARAARAASGGALMSGTTGAQEIAGGVDQRQMRKCLREVTQLPLAGRIIFFRKQA